MAIWQFDVLIAPRGRTRALLPSDSDQLPREVLESADLWEGRQLPPGYERQLEAILPWAPSWDPEWKLFGSEEGTRVDVITEDGAVQEVRLRVDARSLEPEVLERLVGFVSSIDCVLITPVGRVIEPDAMALWVELELSPAQAFVRDPIGFLDRLQRHRKTSQ